MLPYFSGGFLSVGLACKSWTTQEQQNYQAGSESESYCSRALTLASLFPKANIGWLSFSAWLFPIPRSTGIPKFLSSAVSGVERANGDRGKGCSICSLQAKAFLAVKEPGAISL